MSDFRRRLEIANKPYDAEIEYLESSGNQWIDTQIVINSQDYSYIADAMFLGIRTCIGCIRWSPSPTYRTFGVYMGGGTTLVIYYGDYSKSHYNNSVPYSNVGNRRRIYSLCDNDRIIIKQTNGTVNYSYSAILDDSILENTKSLKLFAFDNIDNIDASGELRIYSFCIKKGNNVVLDIIPVRVGQVGYMYDKVSHQLFGNSGTGNFILGPDL